MNRSGKNNSEQSRILIFGAGAIGRSFIAPIFTRGGYEAVFVDVDHAVLEALENRNSYTLIEKSDAGNTSFRINPVRGINAGNPAEVEKELNKASICATCVGAAALPSVLKTIASAIKNRDRPLDIVLAENLKDANVLTREAMLAAGIPDDEIEQRVGIVETSIGKMVPIMPAKISASDPLTVWAEPFNTLIVDRDAFRTPIPPIRNLVAVSPIAPWVARKLYIHNFGHAAAAYLGNRDTPAAQHIWEVLNNRSTANLVKKAMQISGQALCMEYPRVFGRAEINSYIGNLIARFTNRALGDTVYRVGRDLRRKLHRNDRVVGALALVMKHGLDADVHLDVFRAALTFNAAKSDGVPNIDDEGIREKSSGAFLREVVGVEESEKFNWSEALRRVLNEENTRKRRAF